MKFYKFIHIFWGADTKFTPLLVQSINDSNSPFCKDEHLFVTRYKSLYEYLSGYDNIILDTSHDLLLNKYSPHCVCLFSHGLPSLKESLLTKTKYKRKIICRNWGGNRNLKDYSGNLFNNIITFILNTTTKFIFNIKYGKFAAIAIPNIVDEIDIRKMNKSIPLLYMDYLNSKSIKEWLEKLNNISTPRSSKLNILVGHRGTIGDQHLKILKVLKKFEKEDIAIFLVLSYGDKSYIENLIIKAKQLWTSKLTIITEFMSINEYREFLFNIDIGIFDETRSSALGNIYTLLALHKKIFLNKSGIIRAGFDKENIPYCLTDEIKTMSFDEFAKPFDYSLLKESSLYIPYDKIVSKTYSDLENTFNYAEKVCCDSE